MEYQGAPTDHINCGSKNLVICRARDQSLHQGWLHSAEDRNFDFAVSYYGDTPGLYADECCLYEQPTGTKYPSIYKFIINNIDYILQYDAVWIADDDLAADTKTINEMFRLFHDKKLWLAQPSLTKDSCYSHPITLQNQDLLLRYTNSVEVMAPVFSKQALLQCFRHTRPVGSGPVYKTFPLPPEQELRLVANKFNVPLPYQMKVYSACSQTNGHSADRQRLAMRHKPKKVSVIMPVYNSEAYVREAIDSILAQTFTDFELIIIDDGSTDNGLNIIETYKDPRIMLVRNTANLGLIAALNKGIDASAGMYIAIMHADDISKPERLAWQTEFMDRHQNVAVCGSWVETFGAGTAVWSYPIDPKMAKCSLLFRNIVAHPSVIIRKDVLRDEGLYYSHLYPYAEDYALWVKIAEKYDIANLPHTLLKYRLSQGQITSKFRQQQLAITAKIQLEQINALGLKPTEQEYMLHQALGLGKIPHSTAFFEAVLRWFTKLKQANLACRYYPEPSFSYVLRQYLAIVCRATGAAGCEQAVERL